MDQFTPSPENVKRLETLGYRLRTGHSTDTTKPFLPEGLHWATGPADRRFILLDLDNTPDPQQALTEALDAAEGQIARA